MASASYGLRHPASASCLGRHLRLAGRCPNNSSLFPPLAAVVVVAGHLQRKIHFYFRVCRGLRAAPNTFSQVGSLRQTAFCCCQPSAAARQKEHELPRTARRASDLKSAEHKKSFSAATWIFCMEPNSFGVTRGVQPLVRASRASKVAGAFLVLFWHAKENVSGGEPLYKSHPTYPTRKCSAWEHYSRLICSPESSARISAPVAGRLRTR